MTIKRQIQTDEKLCASKYCYITHFIWSKVTVKSAVAHICAYTFGESVYISSDSQQSAVSSERSADIECSA
jgi:hypothetical protein